MKIDAHQHFWSVERGDYDWLTPENTVLYRDFGLKDIKPLLDHNKIDGTVLVQAAPTLAETEYMLRIAENTDRVKGVVGWVDFESDEVEATIKALTAHPKIVGLRPMIHNIADDDWMLDATLDPAFSQLIDSNLAFDALTFPKHLKNLHKLIDRYPEMRVVIDHGSKPHIADAIVEPWASDIARLAEQTNAYVKLSGLVTEAASDWKTEDLQPYVDHLLKTFGPDRMIWGSDWPVCTLASSYNRWCNTSNQLLGNLREGERDAIFGGNAIQFYKLENNR